MHKFDSMWCEYDMVLFNAKPNLSQCYCELLWMCHVAKYRTTRMNYWTNNLTSMRLSTATNHAFTNDKFFLFVSTRRNQLWRIYFLAQFSPPIIFDFSESSKRRKCHKNSTIKQRYGLQFLRKNLLYQQIFVYKQN